MLLGELIKQYRDRHELSAEQFGRMAGLSRVYISNIENNYNPKTKKEIVPTSNVLQKVAKAMGQSVDSIIQQLDDNQLLNVFVKDAEDDSIYSRSADLDTRFKNFLEELENRNDTFIMAGKELEKEDVEEIRIIVSSTFDLLRNLVAYNYGKRAK